MLVAPEFTSDWQGTHFAIQGAGNGADLETIKRAQTTC